MDLSNIPSIWLICELERRGYKLSGYSNKQEAAEIMEWLKGNSKNMMKGMKEHEHG